MNVSDPILNPNTPLAFVTAEEALGLTIALCLRSITVGAWCWDTVMSIAEEHRTFRKRRWRFPDYVYFLSRIASGVFVVVIFVYRVAPLENCQIILQSSLWLAAAALQLNSLLFLLRLCGIFHDCQRVKGVFVVLWLAELACSVLSSFSAYAKHVGPTKQCYTHSLTSFAPVGYIGVAVYDTLVFLTVSVKILRIDPALDWKSEVKLFFNNKHMSHVYRTLLRTGQLYYFATVCANIVLLAIMFSPTISPALRISTTCPNVLIQNSMACKVFRLLRLEAMDGNSQRTISHELPVRTQTPVTGVSATDVDNRTGKELDSCLYNPTYQV
ncbi:hypothetical protein QCA50_006534 [Cerrena zonata]|uniref:Transmembrane protein n=1 Tax=Cerrena zonata TaxID=2478898 RepID=A0AAW0G906_9APHY